MATPAVLGRTVAKSYSPIEAMGRCGLNARTSRRTVAKSYSPIEANRQ